MNDCGDDGGGSNDDDNQFKMCVLRTCARSVRIGHMNALLLIVFRASFRSTYRYYVGIECQTIDNVFLVQAKRSYNRLPSAQFRRETKKCECASRLNIFRFVFFFNRYEIK